MCVCVFSPSSALLASTPNSILSFQAYTNELEEKVDYLTRENERLKKQQEEVGALYIYVLPFLTSNLFNLSLIVVMLCM